MIISIGGNNFLPTPSFSHPEFIKINYDAGKYFKEARLLQEINYDSARGGVSVITEKGDITTSYLLIQRAKPSDSGQYTCSPSNANSKSINVHILAGKSVARCVRYKLAT